MHSDLQGRVQRTTGLAEWFIRYALLLPVIVMASYYIGRGLGDSLQLLYVLSGLYAMRSMEFNLHKKVIYSLILLLVIFLISVLYPEFSARSLKYWVLYGLSGLVLVFTVGTFAQESHESSYRAMVWVPVVLLVGLAIELGYFAFIVKDFHPAVQVNGMILAALAPLVLLIVDTEKGSRLLLYGLFYGAAFLLLLLADSRTELLMLAMGAALFFTFYYRKFSTLIIILPMAILLVIVSDAFLFRAMNFDVAGDTYTWLDRLSSSRLKIWREALLHPPENYLTGVGMHRSMEFLGQLNFVKHLHNLFIEIWYETGLLGLAAYLLLLFVLLSGLPQAYRSLQGLDRRIYAVFFASGIAAMIGALLDKGYIHPLARYYMLFCFTMLYLFHKRYSNASA